MKPQIIYMITEGLSTNLTFHQDKASIIYRVRRACESGLSHLQIREKQLNTKNLVDLTRELLSLKKELDLEIFVNDRADVAAICKADGVHLRSNSIPANIIKNTFPELSISISAHNEHEIAVAEKNRCDLVLLAPIFESPGKGKPLGIEKLNEFKSVYTRTKIVVLGGIDLGNIDQVLFSDADGFAAIRAFNDPKFLQKIASL